MKIFHFSDRLYDGYKGSIAYNHQRYRNHWFWSLLKFRDFHQYIYYSIHTKSEIGKAKPAPRIERFGILASLGHRMRNWGDCYQFQTFFILLHPTYIVHCEKFKHRLTAGPKIHLTWYKCYSVKIFLFTGLISTTYVIFISKLVK